MSRAFENGTVVTLTRHLILLHVTVETLLVHGIQYTARACAVKKESAGRPAPIVNRMPL